MSISVKRDSLSKKEEQSMLELLVLHPKTKGESFGGNTKEPIFFFTKIAQNIHLPYYIGNRILENKASAEYKYPQASINFKQKLREGQTYVIKEALSSFEKTNTAVICAPTGYGKTLMGCYLACERSLITAVICNREIIAKQWQESFAKNTDAKVWIVGEATPKEANVLICMSERVSKLPPEFLKQIGFLIIDEAHTLCTPSAVVPLLSFTPKYILAETATPERSDGMECMIDCLCGANRIAPQYFAKNGKTYMTLAGFTSEVKEFKVVKINTSAKVVTKQNKQGKLDWANLLNDLAVHEARNNLICQLACHQGTKDKKIIILVYRKNTVDILKEILLKCEEKVETLSGNKSSYTNCRILIGTVSKMGTGFDEENLCLNFDGKKADILIICASFRDKSLLTQVAGRIFRSETPIIYHLVDDIGTIKNHWKIAEKWYNSRGANISELTVNKTSSN